MQFNSLRVEASSKSRLETALFYGFVALLAYLAFRIFEPFLAPLAWAAILAVVFYSWEVRMRSRWGPNWAALAATVGVTLILVIPVILVAIEFIRQGIAAARNAELAVTSGQLSWANRGWIWMESRVPGGMHVDLSAAVKQWAERMAGSLALLLGAVLGHVARFAFDLGVTIFAMFYFFRDGDRLVLQIRDLLPLQGERRERMVGETRVLIFATVLSTLATAALHGVVGGAVFTIVGIGAPLFWGVAMAFASLIPVVGSAIVWAPAAIILMLHGRIGSGVLIVVVCAGVVLVVENVLRPWLISGRAQLSGLVVFIGVLGGISVFGVLGVVLGPIIVAAAASLVEMYAEER